MNIPRIPLPGRESDNYSVGQADVYTVLGGLDIPFEYREHPPAPTVEEARKYWTDDATAYCKNLFFRNHRGDRHYLVVMECSRSLNISELEKRLRQGKLSFASGQRMQKYLGLQPGSVSPFGLINDSERHVYVFFDKKLQEAQKISFHPNDNRASLVMPAAGFWKYMEWTKNRYEFIDM
jgi:Ala-tRNA(Pro) deacylase